MTMPAIAPDDNVDDEEDGMSPLPLVDALDEGDGMTALPLEVVVGVLDAVITDCVDETDDAVAEAVDTDDATTAPAEDEDAAATLQ